MEIPDESLKSFRLMKCLISGRMSLIYADICMEAAIVIVIVQSITFRYNRSYLNVENPVRILAGDVLFVKKFYMLNCMWH